jgi:hypothetical protein
MYNPFIYLLERSSSPHNKGELEKDLEMMEQMLVFCKHVLVFTTNNMLHTEKIMCYNNA